jgi:hypothetical protein
MNKLGITIFVISIGLLAIASIIGMCALSVLYFGK